MSTPQDVNETGEPDAPAQGELRTALLGVRLTPSELRVIRIAAARRDRKPVEYIRDVVLPVAVAEAA